MFPGDHLLQGHSHRRPRRSLWILFGCPMEAAPLDISMSQAKQIFGFGTFLFFSGMTLVLFGLRCQNLLFFSPRWLISSSPCIYCKVPATCG